MILLSFALTISARFFECYCFKIKTKICLNLEPVKSDINIISLRCTDFCNEYSAFLKIAVMKAHVDTFIEKENLELHYHICSLVFLLFCHLCLYHSIF